MCAWRPSTCPVSAAVPQQGGLLPDLGSRVVDVMCGKEVAIKSLLCFGHSSWPPGNHEGVPEALLRASTECNSRHWCGGEARPPPASLLLGQACWIPCPGLHQPLGTQYPCLVATPHPHHPIRGTAGLASRCSPQGPRSRHGQRLSQLAEATNQSQVWG